MRRLLAWLGRRRWALAFLVVYLWSFPYFPAIRSANELPRAYLVMAMVDDGTFAIDRGVRRWGTTADVSRATLLTGRLRIDAAGVPVASEKPVRHGGHYSNKAPGSSMLAIPGYLLLRGWHGVVGGEPSLAAVIWVSRVTTGILPSLAFLWLLWGFLGRFTDSAGARRAALVGFGAGSMFFLYSILFISHPLAAVCIGAAWILAVEGLEASAPPSPRRFAAVGLLAGAALLVDYQAAFAGVPVAIWILVRLARGPAGPGLAAAAAALAGAALPVGILLGYHAICFGGPLVTGYEASETFAHHHQEGFLGMDRLRWEAFVGSTVSGDNGLVMLWPMALLALPGWVLMARRPAWRGHAAVTLAVAVLYLVFISSINFWRGGWQVGPRYVMAMLPFLLPPIVVALAAAERRWWLSGAAVGLCLAGLVSYGLSAAIYPYFPDGRFASPVHEVTLRMLADGHAPWNAGWLIGLSGRASLVPYLALLAALAGWAALPRRAAWRSALVALAVATAVVAGWAAFGDGGAGAERAYRNLVATMPS
jgi:hypothetical protein